MYIGKYTEGYSCYRQLELQCSEADKKLIESCIEFDLRLLSKRPEKKHIHFILGFINFNMIKNNDEAKKHYDIFLNNQNLEKFPLKIINKAKEDLNKINIRQDKAIKNYN